jgi:hypothetical protein
MAAEAKDVVEPAVLEDAEKKLETAKPEVVAQLARDVRGQILGGQRFVTRQSSYEDSLWATWERIKSKFSRYGFAHVAGDGVFTDTDGIYGGVAFLEMRAELVTFLYELAGNVKEDKLQDSIRALRGFLAYVRTQPYIDRIPLLYAKAANLFHNADLGLKRPRETSIFDLDVAKIFAGWYALNGFEKKENGGAT